MANIYTEYRGDTVILQINRPEAKNALNRELVDEIDRFIEKISNDEKTRVLIIHGGDNFAAGADIKRMSDCNEADVRKFLFGQTFNKIASLEIPVIAAIEGYALGGGLELALSCDIRVASVKAKFGFPEIGLGIMPGAGGTIRAPRLIGEAKAKELIFMGEMFNAETALSIGLINKVTGQGMALSSALEWADKLSKLPPVALKAAKKTIDEGLKEPDSLVGIEKEADNWAKLFNTEDQKEGMHAFFEKRTPLFIGK